MRSTEILVYRRNSLSPLGHKNRYGRVNDIGVQLARLSNNEILFDVSRRFVRVEKTSLAPGRGQQAGKCEAMTGLDFDMVNADS